MNDGMGDAVMGDDVMKTPKQENVENLEGFELTLTQLCFFSLFLFF